MRPGPLEDPVISAGFAYHAQECGSREGEFQHLRPSGDAFNEINRIQTRQRLNEVVKTGIPGFIPGGRST
jgi:hypothetical protein